MEKSKIDLHADHLQKVRAEWLASESAKKVLKGSKVSTGSQSTIAGKIWQESTYSDFSGDRIFVVFELRRKGMIYEKAHNLGLEVLDGGYVNLSEDELWKEGIP